MLLTFEMKVQGSLRVEGHVAVHTKICMCHEALMRIEFCLQNKQQVVLIAVVMARRFLMLITLSIIVKVLPASWTDCMMTESMLSKTTRLVELLQA